MSRQASAPEPGGSRSPAVRRDGARHSAALAWPRKASSEEHGLSLKRQGQFVGDALQLARPGHHSSPALGKSRTSAGWVKYTWPIESPQAPPGRIRCRQGRFNPFPFLFVKLRSEPAVAADHGVGRAPAAEHGAAHAPASVPHLQGAWERASSFLGQAPGSGQRLSLAGSAKAARGPAWQLPLWPGGGEVRWRGGDSQPSGGRR